MAERLDKFPEPAANSNVWKYPWKDWLDGGIWRLVKGEDFDVSSESMRVQSILAGRRRNMAVRTQVVDERTLVIQAITSTRIDLEEDDG